MKTPTLLVRWLFLERNIYVVFTALVVCTSTSRGEALIGIVKQPLSPYDPAADSIVTVFEDDGRTTIAGPDTTDDTGRYKFEVAKGKNVIVRARWKPELSTPGSTPAKVLTNPTQADVQLQPARTASAEWWLEAGRQTAKTSDNAVGLVISTLQAADVPTTSIFEFIRGAQSVGKPIDGLAGVGIFDSKHPEIIVQALREVEKEFQTTGSVPTYQQLAPKLAGKLTKEQHLEILGFSAPARDSGVREQWEAAVGKSVGATLKTAVLVKEANFDETLFQNAAMQRPK